MMLQLPLEIFSFSKLIIIHGNRCHLWGMHPYYQVKICVSVSLPMNLNSNAGNSNSNAYRGLADNAHKLRIHILKLKSSSIVISFISYVATM